MVLDDDDMHITVNRSKLMMNIRTYAACGTVFKEKDRLRVRLLEQRIERLE